ncbi:TRAP transporter small permease [Oceanibaculum pacificum]|uniref:TRAP transporter small permease protein n=1 Tax=Oceanibaculum pacificum TaxID=580166 RepID=A0A154VSR4_9PROT|nr:TRAP transporter small permease [Oceanibaculum pacificum]KZD04268.1 hypothetical protein AUP43_12250 [Oceanibaculum pacificum]
MGISPGRLLERLTAAGAVFGGLVLVALTVMTLASVLGRALFALPVPGDYELVELGVATAVFAFLPYCQMRGGHVAVDIFTAKAPLAVRGALDRIGGLLLAGIAVLLCWRLWLGGLDYRQYGETSMILALPVWWGYVPATFFCALLAATALYTALRPRP